MDAPDFRRFTRDDSDELVAFLTSHDWPFHAGGRPDATLVLDRVQSGYYDGDDVDTYWAMRDGERVGLVRLEDLDDDTPLFDVRIRSEDRGHGLGTQVVTWATGHLFTTCAHVRRVEATTRQDNVAMRHVLTRCGYVKEAHYRCAWPAPDGTVRDTVGYAILRTDWETGTTTPVQWDDAISSSSR